MLVNSWVSSGPAKVASALAVEVEPWGIKIAHEDSAAVVSPEASWRASRGEPFPRAGTVGFGAAVGFVGSVAFRFWGFGAAGSALVIAAGCSLVAALSSLPPQAAQVGVVVLAASCAGCAGLVAEIVGSE